MHSYTHYKFSPHISVLLTLENSANNCHSYQHHYSFISGGSPGVDSTPAAVSSIMSIKPAQCQSN